MGEERAGTNLLDRCGSKVPHPPIRIAGDAMFRLGPAVGVLNPAAAGTADDPFLIAGWCITSLASHVVDGIPVVPDVSAGIVLEDTEAHLVIRGTVVDGSPHTLLPGPLGEDEGRQANGIVLDGAANVTVAKTLVRNHAQEGIEADGGGPIIVEGSTVTGNRDGIEVDEASQVAIRDNNVSGNQDDGVDLDQDRTTDTAHLVGNELRDNGVDGVYADVRGTLRLVDNTITGNVWDGAVVDTVEEATITGNTVEDNGDNGVFVSSGENVRARDNVVQGNGDVGVVLRADGSLFERNDVTGNDGYGVEIAVAEGTAAENNTIADNSGGLAVDDATGTTVANNAIEGNGHIGVDVFEATDTAVRSNVIAENRDAPGVSVFDSPETLIGGNDIEGNENGGLDVDRANVTATGNWWGASDGPSGGDVDACTGEVADGSGQEMEDGFKADICFDPWLESPNPDAGLASG